MYVNWFWVLLSITNNSIWHQSLVCSQLNDKTVLFQTIQFCISHLFVQSWDVKSFYLTHRIGPCQVLPLRDQSRPGSDGNKGVLRISQSSCITDASPSDCLVSYLGHSLGRSYSSADMPCVLVSVFYSLSRQGGSHKKKTRNKRYPAKTMTDADYANDLALLANTPAQA